MKRKLFKSIVAAGAVAMICACGDDAASNNATDPVSNDPGTGVIDNPNSSSGMIGSSDAGNLNNPNNSSSSALGNGQNPDNPASSAGGNNQNPNNPTSSSAAPGSSGSVVPGSSADVVPGSSSSSVNTEPELDANGFPTLESYGPPPAEYTKDISATAKRGWNTRYWDACKPHCSWPGKGEQGRTDTTTQESYVAGMTTARNCNIHDVEVPTYTLGNVSRSWFGYEGTNSACTDVKEKGVFTCTDMAPIQVTENLSYAYVAGTADGKCGKCYHLQYDGHFKNEMVNNPPRETHLALKGKHMIVMASNIGMDVAGGEADLPAGQFDLMVPGGGVGAFDALTLQVNKGAGFNWGAGFGGFLTECQNKLGYDSTLVAYQTCIKDMCDAAFGDSGFPNLLRGCHWFADWYMAADNPTYYIEEVECPQYLLDHYLTRINTNKDNNIKKVTDWSTYKKGDVLDTLHCWKAGEAPAEDGWQNPSAGCEN